MRYLLIDFGASYVKTIEFDRTANSWSNPHIYDSPFLTQNTITKNELRAILSSIVAEHNIDAIVICTILGGHYVGDVYHSWKSPVKGTSRECMISGLFSEDTTFHVHQHHKKLTPAFHHEEKLKILGYINDTPLYSSLGDTYCAIESVDLLENHVGINMGTGSQVFYRENGEMQIHMFIPAGRALLTFQRFFKEMGTDMFEYMNQLSVEDVLNASLRIDLNVFKESRDYSVGGSIEFINENNFTKSNMTASIVNQFVRQYMEFIPKKATHIHLLGGIVRKSKIIPDMLRHYLPTRMVEVHDGPIENTHLGMVKLIERHL